MSKALELLRQGPAVERAEKSNPTKVVVNDLDKPVRLFGREVRLAVAARYWRLLERKEKETEAAMKAVKVALRGAARDVMDDADSYVSSVVMGPVKVSRQNRFKPVRYERDDLVDAVGELEYRSMFAESARLGFESIPELRTFVRRCGLAGVEVDGQIEESIKARSSIRERMSELGDSLDTEKARLLDACAEDSALTVGRERRRA